MQPLKEAGYQTAWFGTWHLDGFHERDGRAAMHIVPPEHRRGFDEWIGYENNNSQYDCWVPGGVGKDALRYRLPGHENDEFTNLLIKYIGERGFRDTGHLGKKLLSKAFADLSQRAPLRVGKPNLGGQMRAQDSVLRRGIRSSIDPAVCDETDVFRRRIDSGDFQQHLEVRH